MNKKHDLTEPPDAERLDIMRAFASEREESETRIGQSPIAEPVTTAGGDPAVTGGDVDASPLDAEAVGEEAAGMGNPTPDQDIVDEIGEAAGVVFDDDEPLDFEDKVAARDEERW